MREGSCNSLQLFAELLWWAWGLRPPRRVGLSSSSRSPSESGRTRDAGAWRCSVAGACAISVPLRRTEGSPHEGEVDHGSPDPKDPQGFLVQLPGLTRGETDRGWGMIPKGEGRRGARLQAGSFLLLHHWNLGSCLAAPGDSQAWRSWPVDPTSRSRGATSAVRGERYPQLAARGAGRLGRGALVGGSGDTPQPALLPRAPGMWPRSGSVFGPVYSSPSSGIDDRTLPPPFPHPSQAIKM